MLRAAGALFPTQKLLGERAGSSDLCSCSVGGIHQAADKPVLVSAGCEPRRTGRLARSLYAAGKQGSAADLSARARHSSAWVALPGDLPEVQQVHQMMPPGIQPTWAKSSPGPLCASASSAASASWPASRRLSGGCHHSGRCTSAPCGLRAGEPVPAAASRALASLARKAGALTDACR